MIETNEFQTPITDELLDSLKAEVREQLLDFVTNVPFISRLISPNRKRAKDLPRDDKGRIIVDLADLHIIEDMEYFREAGRHFEKHGCYTLLKPNSNPNSDFMKWLKTEATRCWDGMVRESDGEWIPGLYYFCLNYEPMMLTKIVPGSNIGIRVESFPETWEGNYMRFHYLEQARRGGIYNKKGGAHAMELSRRGCGKSFSLAGLMARNFIFGESREASNRFVTILAAYQKEFLGGKDGTISKFIPIIDFLAENTQFPRARLKDSMNEMVWQSGYKDLDTGTNKGSLNMVIGVSAKDDEDKLRGKRGYILLEEFGAFPNLIKLYNTLRPGVEEGDYTFGLIYCIGTSGEDYNNFQGAEELVKNPRGYNVYPLPNVFDKHAQGRKDFAFFFPGYINRKGCYNSDGVSDVVKALLQILEERYRVKYNSEDPNTIIRTMAEIPITPAEALVRTSFNMFPINDLNERLLQLEANNRLTDDTLTGSFTIVDGKVDFKITTDTPIRSFPNKSGSSVGCVEIFALPEKGQDGKVFSNRYIMGADPFDTDGGADANTLSLGSVFCLDLWTDNIVCEYTGRPDFVEDYFEICRRMALFYNAQLNYENNKKGLFPYFSKYNCLHLLTDNLEYLKDKQNVKEAAYGNRLKGTSANAVVNNLGRSLFRTWLLKEDISTTLNEDGEEIETKIPHLYTVKNKALLQEAVSYNSDANFDRISAIGMLMLLREDKMILYQGNIRGSRDTVGKDYLGNDDFFTKNFNIDGEDYF